METLHRFTQGQSYFITCDGALSVLDGTLEILNITKAGQYSFVASSEEIKIVKGDELTTYKVTVNFKDAPIVLNGGETEAYVIYREVGWDSEDNRSIVEPEIYNGEKIVNQTINLNCYDPNNMKQWATPAFNKPISIPNIKYCNNLLNDTSFNQPLSLPNAINCQSLLAYTPFNQPLSLPNALICNGLLSCAESFNQSLDLPKAVSCNELLMYATLFNQPISLPKADTCVDAFYRTALNAENINFILRSLPDRTGKPAPSNYMGTITFTGSPGAATCDPTIGTKKNWTVQV